MFNLIGLRIVDVRCVLRARGHADPDAVADRMAKKAKIGDWREASREDVGRALEITAAELLRSYRHKKIDRKTLKEVITDLWPSTILPYDCTEDELARRRKRAKAERAGGKAKTREAERGARIEKAKHLTSREGVILSMFIDMRAQRPKTWIGWDGLKLDLEEMPAFKGKLRRGTKRAAAVLKTQANRCLKRLLDLGLIERRPAQDRPARGKIAFEYRASEKADSLSVGEAERYRNMVTPQPVSQDASIPAQSENNAHTKVPDQRIIGRDGSASTAAESVAVAKAAEPSPAPMQPVTATVIPATVVQAERRRRARLRGAPAPLRLLDDSDAEPQMTPERQKRLDDAAELGRRLAVQLCRERDAELEATMSNIRAMRRRAAMLRGDPDPDAA
jgi:hypothetical protein